VVGLRESGMLEEGFFLEESVDTSQERRVDFGELKPLTIKVGGITTVGEIDG